MHKTKLSFLFRLAALSGLLVAPLLGWAQVSVPFKLVNNSANNGTYYPDSEIYVAVVGEYLSKEGENPTHIWVDPTNNQIHEMNISDNTVTGPTRGPGNNYQYANCFVKLSNIPNQTFTLPPIQGCRVYVSFKKQLYFYFYGPRYISKDEPGGYSAPNPLNEKDPNLGTKFDIIELTNNQYGFFGNTSRVDAYQYPMGLELSGEDGSYTRVGDLKKHDDIVALYKANVPAEFKTTFSITPTGEIYAPSKSENFREAEGLKPAGANVNYLKAYIDAIWNGFKTKKLTFYAGDAGVFSGQVGSDDTLRLTGLTSTSKFYQKVGRIARPSTQDAFEGKNTLATGSELDKVVQAQMCAAINRHVVDYNTTAQQNWYDASQFYTTPWNCNYYSKFWHKPGININTLAYGFAYDDVAEQSPSLHTDKPTLVAAFVGGFVGRTLTPTNAAPKISLTSPSPSATYTGRTTITLAATAVDDGSISKVEFYQNGNLLNTDTSAPYSYSWPNVPAGTYDLTAKAIDNTGLTATTWVTKVTVDNNFTPGPSGYCLSSADFSYKAVTNTSNTATFTFSPIGAAGGNMVLLYLKNAAGLYDGYFMSKDPATGNFTYTTAGPLGTGTQLYFTYNYKIGTTSRENNTSAAPFTYTAGTGCTPQARSTATSSAVLGNTAQAGKNSAEAVEFLVAPNPSHERTLVHFTLPEASSYALTLYDLNGRELRTLAAKTTAGTHAVELNTRAYPAGVYLLRLVCGPRVYTQRVEVRH